MFTPWLIACCVLVLLSYLLSELTHLQSRSIAVFRVLNLCSILTVLIILGSLIVHERSLEAKAHPIKNVVDSVKELIK